jgi:uncharacterized protein with GYD domain
MAIYIILRRIAPDAFQFPTDFKSVAAEVMDKIKQECPGLVWKESYATMGRFDFVDIVESDDFKQVEKAAMIIRYYGKSTTETMPATPWAEFLANF